MVRTDGGESRGAGVPVVPRPLPQVPLLVRDRTVGGTASLLCSPLVAGSETELLLEAEQAGARGPDLVEWRADYFRGLEPARVSGLLRAVRERAGVPVLFTCRAAGEGGAGVLPEEVRLAALGAATQSGLADLVDVELATDPKVRSALLAVAAERRVPVVLSAHYLQDTPSEAELLDVLRQEQEEGASVAKLATMARTPEDGLRLLLACAHARASFLRIPLIGIAMGPAGSFTRVLGPLFGVDMTFAAAVNTSAPGQLDLEAVREARRLMGIP